MRIGGRWKSLANKATGKPCLIWKWSISRGLSEIQGEGQNSRLNDATSFFGGMASLAAAGGAKLAKAAQTFVLQRRRLLNSYVAFTAVLRDPSFIGRPFARIDASSAAVLAQGADAVRCYQKLAVAGSIGGNTIGQRVISA
ncbi:MAG: hypothetical protein U5N55_03590 [Cypionkella sp.]|nr:hypothetical protein [Cypionkella sp.]